MNPKLMLKGIIIVGGSGAVSAGLFSLLIDDIFSQENLFLAVFGGFCGAIVGAIAGVLFWGLLGAFDKTLIGVFNFAGAFFGLVFGSLVGGFFGSLFLLFSINWIVGGYSWFIMLVICLAVWVLINVIEEVSGDKDEEKKIRAKNKNSQSN